MPDTDEALAMYVKALVTGFCLSIKDSHNLKLDIEPQSGTAQTIGQKLAFVFPNGTKLQVSFDLIPPGHWEICDHCGMVLYNDRTDPEEEPIWLAAIDDSWICPVGQGPHRVKEV